MDERLVAWKAPLEVDADKANWWCVCGRSGAQLFCDGTALVPLEWVADHVGTVGFCGCKRTGSVPICDGSHKAL